MPHICVQTLPMRSHSHSKNTLDLYYCKINPHQSIQYFQSLGLYTGKEEHKHHKVRLIHLKHKIKPPAITFCQFPESSAWKAELNILYSFFTFLFDVLYKIEG